MNQDKAGMSANCYTKSHEFEAKLDKRIFK